MTFYDPPPPRVPGDPPTAEEPYVTNEVRKVFGDRPVWFQNHIAQFVARVCGPRHREPAWTRNA